MSWNYRVCKETLGKGTDYEEVHYTIREVYYKDDSTIHAMTEHSTGVSGSSMSELVDVLTRMNTAFTKAPLDLDGTIFASERVESPIMPDWATGFVPSNESIQTQDKNPTSEAKYE